MRISRLTLVDDVELGKIVAQSRVMTDVLKHFGLTAGSSNFATLHRVLDAKGIQYQHLIENRYASSRTNLLTRKIPTQLLLVENSRYNRGKLKKRLIRDGLLENKCSLCGQHNAWNGKPLVMIIDHINGVPNDNRFFNLRLVCPNCGSQLDTHCGKKLRFKDRNCLQCGLPITRLPKNNKSGICRRCWGTKTPRKVEVRPSPSVLLSEIQKSSWSAVSEKYGVSDNAVRKWAKAMGLPTNISIKTFVLPSQVEGHL